MQFVEPVEAKRASPTEVATALSAAHALTAGISPSTLHKTSAAADVKLARFDYDRCIRHHLLVPQLAAVDRFVAEQLFDPQQLVVLADAIGATGRTGLDLPGAQGHGEV